MSQRISLVIAQLKLNALPSPCKSETATEKAARQAQLKPKALAQVADLSVSQFYAAFKAETEQTPSQVVKKQRLTHASALLVNTLYRVNEIAELSDYADVYHFSRDFKLAHEFSPLAFRRRNAKN